MGFKFRKSFKIAPGVRLNLTKKGLNSTSLGVKGATVNVGKKGAKATVGIPGSGVSYETPSSRLPGCLSVFAVLICIFFGVRSCFASDPKPTVEAASNAGWGALVFFIATICALISLIALIKPMKFALLNSRAKAGIALAASVIGGFILVGILAVSDPTNPKNTHVQNVGAEPVAPYAGATYQSLQIDTALSRLQAAGSDMQFTTEQMPDGQECRTATAYSGTLVLCSFGGKVSLVKFTTLGAMPNKKPPHELVTETFMAILGAEPYTAADRARIHREMATYLSYDDNNPRVLTMNTMWVQVYPQRVNYTLIADPNVSSALDLR